MLVQRLKRAFLFGLLVGLVFGCINLVLSWWHPLDDDSPGSLLAFYGPMFAIWAASAFWAVQRGDRVMWGLATGAVAAFATFCVYDLLILIRVNIFLPELVERADWQRLMTRFEASGSGSLRLFVTLDYVKGLPLKNTVASLIGAIMGLVGGSLGRLFRTRCPPTHFRHAAEGAMSSRG